MKKRTKQVWAALLSVAMVLSVTACGSETAEEKETVSDSSKEEGSSGKIELSVSHIMVNESDSQVAAWNKALGEYKETHPDIVIKEDKADNDAYKTKLKTTLAAGSASDIFYSWGGGFSESFVEAGIVENLDSYVESGVIDMDKMMPNICNNFYYDDSLYGLPLDSFMGVLMCNQELFDKYNLEVPKTMEELYHVSEVFLENGITPLALGEKDKWPGLFPFGILSLRYGGVEENTALLNGEGNFDQEFVKRAAGELENLVEKGVFSDSAVALTNDEAKNEFLEGRAAMFYNGSWGVADLDVNSKLAGKLTVTNWPTVEDGAEHQNEYIGGASATLMVSSKSPHKEEAVEFAVFMSQKFSEYGYESGAHLPTWKYEGNAELSDMQVQLMEMMEKADGFCLAWDTLLDSETADIHSNSLQGIYAKQTTAEEYIKAMTATRE